MTFQKFWLQVLVRNPSLDLESDVRLTVKVSSMKALLEQAYKKGRADEAYQAPAPTPKREQPSYSDGIFAGLFDEIFGKDVKH